jgi:transcriptional regulator with GAF, ATPase, and Fis domain
MERTLFYSSISIQNIRSSKKGFTEMTDTADNSSFPVLKRLSDSLIFTITKRIITIGSAENCQIRLEDSSMPLRLAHIIFELGNYYIAPLSNGIKISLNNKPLDVRTALQSGDKLSFANTQYLFCDNAACIQDSTGISISSGITNPNGLLELISTIVVILKNRDKDVFNDLVASISRLLHSDAARLVFEDPISGTRQTIARFPFESNLDRFSNKAIDWAKNASKTILSGDDQWGDPSQSITINKVASILCAPLKEGETPIGFLYLDRLKTRAQFTEEERIFCDALIPLFEEILKYHSERQQQQITIDHLQRERLIYSGGLIYNCTAMQKVIDLVGRFSKADSPILLLGETGTGKELLARLIHQRSNRAEKPFKAVNCGAIPENLIEAELFGNEKGAFTGADSRRIGLLEAATDGTVFLDEIGELPIQMQVKLLRALQENEISRLGGHEIIKTNVRILAATNRNLETEISNGKFRQDLYFRLNVLSVKLPPLRERDQDILLLADYFIKKFCQQFGTPLKMLSPQSQTSLTAYDWPGNVRELENIIQKAILMSSGTKISSDDIAIAGPTSRMTLKEARSIAEKELITQTLKKTKGNISLSSKLLEIDRKWLMKIMEDLGIDVDEYRK